MKVVFFFLFFCIALIRWRLWEGFSWRYQFLFLKDSAFRKEYKTALIRFRLECVLAPVVAGGKVACVCEPVVYTREFGFSSIVTYVIDGDCRIPFFNK